MYSVLLFILILLTGCHNNSPRTYSTRFGHSEDPISENGNWINGKTTGLDWSDVSSESGIATGHQMGDVHYADATALLTGVWGADQSAEAEVFAATTYASDYPEVELRLRSSLSPHKCSGYEIAYSVAGKTEKAYVMIVRWNGPAGDFTVLNQPFGPQYAAGNGDRVKATITGSTIIACINGVEVARATDSTFRSGSPGMGFNFDWAGQGKSTGKGSNTGYGFKSFSASDNLRDTGKE
jgi:hypothetical protein